MSTRISFKDLYNLNANDKMHDLFLNVEVKSSEKTSEEVRDVMKKHLLAMKESIIHGLSESVPSQSGMSGTDAPKIMRRYEDKSKLNIFNPVLTKVLSYAIAIAEENQRMGRIVACPTAGSCGIVPAAIIAISEELNIEEEKQIDALIIVAGIGKLVAQEVSLAGAVAGCQAECGVAAAMAAAGVTYLMNGSNEQIINAAALSLKNLLGLVCDPVAGLVEVPCIKRNGFLAIHAITGAECAMSGITSVIPLDEIVNALKEIGSMLPPSLKETSKGGLAVSPTAEKITAKLQKIWNT